MRRLLALAVLGLLAAACEDTPAPAVSSQIEGADDPPGDFYRVTVDGVDCIVYEDLYTHSGAGGLSCDWTDGHFRAGS